MRVVAVLVLCFYLVFGGIPIIIDTDYGQEMDDSWAISVALASPEFDIKLILTATHNTTGQAQQLCKFLQTVNRTDIPVGIGLSQDARVGPLYGWAKDYKLSSYPGKLYTSGIKAALDIINSSPTPVTILELAPVGNLKEMLKIQPSVAKKAKIVAMAGSIYKCYDGPGPCPEYNIYDNVPAAQAVYNASWNITITPLDTCGIAVVYGDTYQTFLAANNSAHPLVQTLLMNYVYFNNHGGDTSFNPRNSSTILYDTVAAYLAYSNRSLVNMQKFTLNITGDGTMISTPTGKLVDVAITWAPNGLQGWAKQLVDRLIKYKRPSL
eukprot:Phypoly_transcript_09891.p1 GENE.Phypoly_transcript_09891~~Phypoly_transcript_09891.p1  ORF type:complete len:330 (+),score=38.74 Phypoly_transcript_09891:24-992(+)